MAFGSEKVDCEILRRLDKVTKHFFENLRKCLEQTISASGELELLQKNI